VHAQVACDAVTVTVLVPPALSIMSEVGEIVNVHGAGAAACVAVKVRPAIVTVPERAAPVVAAYVSPAPPVPLPPPPDPIGTHHARAAPPRSARRGPRRPGAPTRPRGGSRCPPPPGVLGGRAGW